MDNPVEEEEVPFLEPVEEIVETVVEEEPGDLVQVEHEEVLEEIVHEEEEVMYDAEGRLIEYQDMMVYEDDAEVIEEYVEVEDLGNGEYAYVMTDEHGNRRLLKPEEIEAVKKMPGMLEEEEIIEQKAIGSQSAGPSTSTAYIAAKRGRFPPAKADAPKRTVNYYPPNLKRIRDAKIEVEKYIPQNPINRRPLPDNHDFKMKARNRKNPPWQEDLKGAGSSSGRRSPSPIIKEPLFPVQEEEEEIVRFKCAECTDGFSMMDRLCDHMIKNHDCSTSVRTVEFFNDREFESFLQKIEKATLGRDPEEVIGKKSRNGSSQMFVCNYMTKGRGKKAELVEVPMATLAEKPIEACSAFVQKVHSYECIRVKYCDQHVHFDGNIGFRVPIAVKRRLFEMSFKRLPIPCMQVMLAEEAESLLPNPTRFEEKLKHFSHVEIIELLGIINESLRKYQDVEGKSKKVPIKFDTVKTAEGPDALVVKRIIVPKKEPTSKIATSSEEPTTSSAASSEFRISDDGNQEIPMMAREIEILDEDDEQDFENIEGCDGAMVDSMLYDPENGRDPLFDELTEIEMGVLEAYEKDIRIHLTEEQKQERIRQKAKFSLSKVLNIYQSLDTATHGLTSSELHTETINQLREMASYVVELVCQLDAEVKAQFNPSIRVDDIKRDMIAGIAMQERVYQPERRPRKVHPVVGTPTKPRPFEPARTHEEYAARVLGNTVDVHRFDAQHQRLQMLRAQRQMELRNAENVNEVREESEMVETKPQIAPPPSEKVPWIRPPRKRQPADPNAPPRKRTRQKKEDVVATSSEPAENSGEKSVEMPAEIEKVAEKADGKMEKKSQKSASQKKEKETEKTILEENETEKQQAPPTEEPSTSTPTTKTRTGRVVKPKKFDDA